MAAKEKSISALAICVWAALNCMPATAKQTNSEWMLEQTTDMGGINTVFVTHDAVKVINSRHGCNLITKAPSWQVHCYQPQEKLEWIGEMSLFSGIVMTNPYALPRSPHLKVMKELGNGSLNGMKYTKYGISKSIRDQVFGADDISVAPQAAEFLARLYSNPYIPKVPIYQWAEKRGRTIQPRKQTNWMDTSMANDMRGGVVVALSTKSCKKVPYKASDFELPKGYKRTADIIAVTFSPDKKNQINDIVDSVGFTYSPSKSNETPKKP